MVERKEEVVISGIGGCFPEANNVEELKDLLFSKMNGVTLDSRRWDSNKLGVRNGTGKMKNVYGFDAKFFKMHPKLAQVTDMLTKLCLERSIEAVIDAGLSPDELSGTNTGVFTCSAISETETCFLNSNQKIGFVMLGQSRTMQANRLSYVLNLKGPSFTMDGGWICSAEALEKAKSMIENGLITSALIGVTNLCFRPEIQYQYQGLNKLNQGICTKPFSLDADGYNRSEACIVMLLQKASEAKRSYATLLNVNSTQFGDNHRHITEYNGIHFKSLLLDCYKKANIDPASVEYVEAYGSGIKNEDNVEINVMEEVFCTEQRKTPLKVGSVKSNVGHCEVSGLFMSIVKAIIALDSGYIPPNINYAGPNENLTAMRNGKIQIVTERTPFVSDVIGISSFGFLNAFSHVILRRNDKEKCGFKNGDSVHTIPRIIMASGCNEENARETVNTIIKRGNDAEFVALTYEVFTKNISTHFYRSYSIFPSLDESKIHPVTNVSPTKRPVWFIFSGMGSQWHGMGSYLMKIPIFAEAIDDCDTILRPRGIDIKHVLTSHDSNLFDNILNSFVGIAAVQIGLVNVLRALDVVPDGIIGHSVGELGCAYADGCLTAEEMLLSAYVRGRVSLETDLIPGMMAAVGLGYRQIKDRLPHDVDVACHNSATSSTISGPVDSINAVVSRLTSEGIFAKSVNVAGIAYHSRYIQSAGPTLLKYLKEVIKVPKSRSSKWISTSLPESEWNSDVAKCSSAEYHTNNLLSSVLFEDALKHVPSDAIAIEIAPHGLLQAIVKKALPDTVSNIPLTKRSHGDSVRFLLSAIGEMYCCGLNPTIQGLYPRVTFPVSRGTPPLSSLPFWDHTEQQPQTEIINMMHQINSKSAAEKFTLIHLPEEIHLFGYQIHGHHIIPPSFFLFYVWKWFAEMNDKTVDSTPVQFNNLQFKNNIEIHLTQSRDNYTMIQYGSGLFECNIDNELVFSGQIRFLDEKDLNTKSTQPTLSDEFTNTHEGYLLKNEIYTILENNGYGLGDNYKNILNVNISEKRIQGHVKWMEDWVYFIDGLLCFTLLEDLETQKLNAPIYIREIKINPVIVQNISKKDIYVSYDKVINEINCIGVRISNVKNASVQLPKCSPNVFEIEEKTFFKFDHSSCKNIDEFIRDSMDIILETDRLNFDTVNRKLIVCTPYHYDDSIFKACAKSLKNFLDNQLSINTITLTWDNIKKTSEHDETGKFIMVTNVNYLHDTVQVLANTKYSYIIVCSERKIQDLKNWNIIMQQNFNDRIRLALIKKDTILDEKSVFVKHTINNNHDLSIWRALDKCRGTINVILKSEPFEGIEGYVKNMLKKYKSQRLRFLFILDSNAPDCSSDELFYKNQLAKGLTINIYKNGGWGSFKKTPVQHLNKNTKIVENPIEKIFALHSNDVHAVKYLGLNYKDLVVEDDSENEFGPFDYSGLVKNGTLLMGIASFENKGWKINYDSFLSWPVPPTWSPEDATTVPLTYAMAYYVFNVLCSLQRKNSILVTSGLHPMGRAAIAIGLAEKCETYAVVESTQNLELLSEIFPELPRSRILVNVNGNFDVRLMDMTKSKGVDLVLNFLSGKAFQSAFRTIAYHGKFFHFSKYDMKTYGNIGTRVFLRNTSFTVVSFDTLLNESDETKRLVHLAFSDGLNKGVVKPFPRFDLTASSKCENIFATVRSSSTSNVPKKVVLFVNDFSSYSNSLAGRDKYKFCADHVNVIVDNASDWLDLAEWLVDRGAQKIVVIVKKYSMSSVNCRRFNRLISRNLTVQVESDIHLKTKEDSLNWLNCLTSFSVLGSLFIINQLDDGKIDNLRYAFAKNKNKTKTTSFVCMSSNGEVACADLSSIGLRALNISWNETSLRQKNASKILPSLDTLLLNSNTAKSSSFVCSEKITNKSEQSQKMNDVIANYFPNSVDDVHSLNEIIINDAEFVEVQTRSPRLSQLKSVVPVFVIPGFRPKIFESFYKQFFYPVFEARLPERVDSIDNLSRTLVDKMKIISNNGSVSLIGESWGGVVALKMAQILEANGTLVTVSLLNGDPKTVFSWAESFLSQDYYANKLNIVHGYNHSDKFSNYGPQTDEEDLLALKVSTSKKLLEENTSRALSWIRSSLRTLLDTEPWPNKLCTKVLVFTYEKTQIQPNKIHNLTDYCLNPPCVHLVSGTDYKQMTADPGMISIITDTVGFPYAAGNEMSLSDKYKNFYFKNEKLMKLSDV